MKYLVTLLLLLSVTAMAHNWPYPVTSVSGLHKAGYCFNSSNCTINVMKGRAQRSLETRYCVSSGACAPANGEYFEVHIGEYWYNGALQGQYRRENHLLFQMIKDFPVQGQDYFQFHGSPHYGEHCPDHNYSPYLTY